MLKDESGLSLIEAALSVMVSTVVMIAIQMSINDLIFRSVNRNTAYAIGEIVSTVECKMSDNGCNKQNTQQCNTAIEKIKAEYKSDKLDIDILKTEKDGVYDIFLVYKPSSNELINKDVFKNILISSYGNNDGYYTESVLKWWRVDNNNSIFGKYSSENFNFYKRFEIRE